MVLVLVLTLRWAALARTIAELSGAVGLRYGPVARVLCWIVPVWGWFGPKQVVNDLWAAFDPTAALRVDAAVSRTPRWLLWWWAPLVAASLIVRVATGAASTVAGTQWRGYLLLLGLAVSVGSGPVFVRIVRRISERQVERAANLGLLIG